MTKSVEANYEFVDLFHEALDVLLANEKRAKNGERPFIVLTLTSRMKKALENYYEH